MKRNVTGFMQLCVGLTYAPTVSVDGKSHDDSADFDVTSDEVSGPGYSVAFYLIPTWQKNGLYFGASYDLSAIRFNHETGDGDAAVSGESSMGIADMTLRLGYVRYFGKREWHPYFLGGAGLSWQTAQLSTDYAGQDDKVEDSNLNTPLLDLGIGIGKETMGGMFSAELRADIYPLTLEHEYPGPHDRFDLEVQRPAIIKLMAVFSIGHL